MTEQITPAAAPADTKEPSTLEEVKQVMEEHGSEAFPKPEKPRAHSPAPETEPEKPAAKSEERKNPAATAPEGYVPKEALQHARAEAREEKRKLALMEGMISEMKAQRTAPVAAQEQKEPDRRTDPDGWFQWKIEKQDRELSEVRKFREQTTQQAEQNAAVQRLASHLIAQEVEYEAKNPDYYDSLRFLEKQRHEYYLAQGIDDPAQRQNLIMRDKLQVAQQALQLGITAPVFFHNLAKSHGYAPAAPIAPAPKPAPTVADDPTLAAAAKGQARASQSLSKAGASPDVSDEVTIESLARLKGAAFDSAFVKFRRQKGLT